MDIESLEKKELKKKQILVALLFVCALAVALLFSSWMGLFGLGPHRHIYVGYDFAGGLDKGSPVRLAGIKVGRVSEVQFNPGQETTVMLKLEINKKAMGEITQDSAFYINLAGLIGERYVEVVPGKGAALEPGSKVRGIDPPRVDQLISQGYGIFGDLRKILEENKDDLKSMISALNELTQNLNKLVSQATPAQKQKLNAIINNVAAITEDLKTSMNGVAAGVQYMRQNKADKNWDHLTSLIQRAHNTSWNDIRRLLLEDGVKVNLGSKKVVDEKIPAQGASRE